MEIKLFGVTYTFIPREGDRLTIEREDVFVKLPSVTARAVLSEGSYELVFTNPEDLADTEGEQDALVSLLSNFYTRNRAQEVNPQRIIAAAEDWLRDVGPIYSREASPQRIYVLADVPPVRETNEEKRGFPCFYVTAHVQVDVCACEGDGEFSLSDGDQIPTCLACGGIELLPEGGN